MAAERRVVVGWEDVTVLFECKTCLSRVAIPTKTPIKVGMASACPACGDDWGQSTAASLLKKAEELAGEQSGFKVLLQFDEPTMESPTSKRNLPAKNG